MKAWLSSSLFLSHCAQQMSGGRRNGQANKNAARRRVLCEKAQNCGKEHVVRMAQLWFTHGNPFCQPSRSLTLWRRVRTLVEISSLRSYSTRTCSGSRVKCSECESPSPFPQFSEILSCLRTRWCTLTLTLTQQRSARANAR